MRFLFLVPIMVLAGCIQERPSEIVKKVEAAGAGNVRSASQESIEQWFRNHGDVAREIKQLCAPVQQSAPANWGDTTEGRVCKAASVSSVFQFTPRKGDGKGFKAGEH